MIGSQSGLTLIETTVAVVVLAGVVVVVYGLLASSTDVSISTSRAVMASSDARRALDLMVRELRAADAATLEVSEINGADQVELRVATGFTLEVEWSSPIIYRYVGGGEGGRIVRIQDERIETVQRSVQPGGLRIDRDGDRVTVGIDVEVADSRGRPMVYSTSASVTLRNTSE